MKTLRSVCLLGGGLLCCLGGKARCVSLGLFGDCLLLLRLEARIDSKLRRENRKRRVGTHVARNLDEARCRVLSKHQREKLRRARELDKVALAAIDADNRLVVVRQGRIKVLRDDANVLVRLGAHVVKVADRVAIRNVQKRSVVRVHVPRVCEHSADGKIVHREIVALTNAATTRLVGDTTALVAISTLDERILTEAKHHQFRVEILWHCSELHLRSLAQIENVGALAFIKASVHQVDFLVVVKAANFVEIGAEFEIGTCRAVGVDARRSHLTLAA